MFVIRVKFEQISLLCADDLCLCRGVDGRILCHNCGLSDWSTRLSTDGPTTPRHTSSALYPRTVLNGNYLYFLSLHFNG